MEGNDGTKVAAMTAEGKHVDIRGAVAVARAEEAKVRGFSGAVMTSGSAKLRGATPVLVARDNVKMRKAGSVVALAGREIRIGENGFVGVALSPKVSVERGGRVLITPLVAFLALLAFGAGFGIVLLGGYLAIRNRGPLHRLRTRRMLHGTVFRDVTRSTEDLTKAVRKALSSVA